MPELPVKKIGLVTCSGEELPEGTATRLAALRVLEDLRPGETVTICLPLFLAGGEGDRAYARYYPTIAIDGCSKRCAFYGTGRYSKQPVASLVMTELIEKYHMEKPLGLRKLNTAGMQVVELAANQLATMIDALLGKSWNRVKGEFNPSEKNNQPANYNATCSCGSGIAAQSVNVNGEEITILALPLIFDSFREQKKEPSKAVMVEMMQMVAVYNCLPAQRASQIQDAITKLYADYYQGNKK